MTKRLDTARCVVLVTACLLVAADASAQTDTFTMRRFQPIQPLDYEYLELLPSGERMTMLLTLDAPELDGWELHEGPGGRYIRDRDGKIVTKYPERVRFRFTVGTRLKTAERQPMPIELSTSGEELKANLRFRLKRFRGLNTELIEPAEAKIIGVPANIPYDDRVYRLDFKLKNVPVDDRFHLEVLDEAGNRVAKFGFFLL